MHSFFAGLKAPLHISHRGGAGLYPENTLEAFTCSRRLWGTDILELDVHASKDGELVVSHDPTVERCTNGTGAIAELSWNELSSLDAGFRFERDAGVTPFRDQGIRLPLLSQVLDALPTVRLNVELKSAGAVGPFVDLCRDSARLGRMCLGSEDDAIADELCRVLPNACHFFPRNAGASFVFGEDPDPRFTVLDMPLDWEGGRLLSAGLMDRARQFDRWVNVWTVNEPTDMRECVALGVGGIMTDRPDVLRSVLDERH